MRRIVLISLVALITACWQQQDIIEVTAEGMIHISSEVMVTDMSMSKEDVEKLAKAVLEDFIEAGWQMEMRWLSSEKPYRLSFKGKALVKEIQSVKNFYRILSEESGSYTVQFLLAGEQENQVQRSMVLKTAEGVQWLDENSNPVQKINPVDGESRYTLKL